MKKKANVVVTAGHEAGAAMSKASGLKGFAFNEVPHDWDHAKRLKQKRNAPIAWLAGTPCRSG